MAGSSSGLGSSTASVGSTMPGSVANGSAVGSASGKRGTSAVGEVVAGNEVAGLVAGIEVAGLVTGCASLTLAVITFAVGGVVADTVAVSGRPTAGAGNADGAAVVVFAVGATGAVGDKPGGAVVVGAVGDKPGGVATGSADVVGAFGDISGVAGGKPFAGVPVVAGGKAFAGVPVVGVAGGKAFAGVPAVAGCKATVPGSAGTVGAGVACTVCVFTCSATRR